MMRGSMKRLKRLAYLGLGSVLAATLGWSVNSLQAQVDSTAQQTNWAQAQAVDVGALRSHLAAATASVHSETVADIFQGHLVIGHEVEVFRPCGSDTPLWLDYTSEIRGLLSARYEKLTTRPYQETYVVLRGQPGPRLNCGFCEDFEGSFMVSEVLEHHADGPTECR